MGSDIRIAVEDQQRFTCRYDPDSAASCLPCSRTLILSKCLVLIAEVVTSCSPLVILQYSDDILIGSATKRHGIKAPNVLCWALQDGGFACKAQNCFSEVVFEKWNQWSTVELNLPQNSNALAPCRLRLPSQAQNKPLRAHLGSGALGVL